MPKLPRSPYGPFNDSTSMTWQQQSSKSLNGQISFGKTKNNDSYGAPDHANLQIWKAFGVTPGAPNTEFFVLHNLTWVPWHYDYFLDVAGQLYQGPTTGTAWTAATATTQGKVFLKCTVASANYVIIIK